MRVGCSDSIMARSNRPSRACSRLANITVPPDPSGRSISSGEISKLGDVADNTSVGWGGGKQVPHGVERTNQCVVFDLYAFGTTRRARRIDNIREVGFVRTFRVLSVPGTSISGDEIM